MVVHRFAAGTTREYQTKGLRAFNQALCRAYQSMRRSRTQTLVLLPLGLFPTQIDVSFVPYVPQFKDSDQPYARCQDRALYLRPVGPYLMGVSPERHGGDWLSVYLMWLFLVGDEK